MTTRYSRRQLLVGLGAATGAAMAVRPPLRAAAVKPMRGIFPACRKFWTPPPREAQSLP
jgi:hypothetical protein